MLVCVAKPTRQPRRSSPARAVTMNIGYSRSPTIALKAAGASIDATYPGRVVGQSAAMRLGRDAVGRRGDATIGVREGVLEDLGRALALADLHGEGLAGLVVRDGH